ncbi:MAG: DUF1015 domain-containing protein [Gemmataceae bacterium]|nr:DUF1015 domain-containing protein [Gemmata sp.]MDW8198418.1 DUF1015 domain-containing protein [Gemmataceae bacterium]
MADIRAFRGFRYDLGRVGALSDVVAPPYDVIDPALQERLYHQSPYNAIRLELTRAEPTDTDPSQKYARAALTLREWLADNILRQDTARSLYVYEQEYTIEGQTWIRRGFMARVRLEPFGTGKVFPHEQTLSGPKEDRWKLLNATGFNISPIFGLYPDPQGDIFRLLEPHIRTAPPLVARDHLGVSHRLWLVTDSATISQVVGAMGPQPVYIADGHHRYETGLRYLHERRAAGEVLDDEAPANFCLMMLVGMSDPGLLILPTHRLVSGLTAPLTAAQLEALLAPHFDIVERTGTNPHAAWEYIQMDGQQSTLGFGTVADGQWLVAKLRDGRIMAELAPEHSPAWRSLGVSILHQLVLDRLIPPCAGGPVKCQYVHLMSEVTDAVSQRACQLACLVPPATMQHVAQIAGQGEKMPPKSTYFYPKLVTGLVFNSLKKD